MDNLKVDIEGWQTKFDTTGPNEVRLWAVEETTSAAEPREYRRVASDWEYASYRLSLDTGSSRIDRHRHEESPEHGSQGTVSDGVQNPGRERHRILGELRHELERHPAVQGGRGVPDGRFRERSRTLDLIAFRREMKDAMLRVAWWPADPEVVVHYSESSGFDCGFHREANSHVPGTIHYQERANANEDYDYEAVSFETGTPTRLCWVVLN